MRVPSLAKVRDDIAGGLVSAGLAIPLAMGYGMFAFSALGDDYFSYGALSGLYAAMVASVACVVFGDRNGILFAPRVTTTFFLGALLHHIVHYTVVSDAGTPIAILAFFSIILLGGLFQALFGLMKIGTLIRYTPHPVMAGLQNAAAAILFLVQLGNVCGFDTNVPFTAVAIHLSEIKPLSLVVAALTFGTMWYARKITTKVPPLIIGLSFGCAAYLALHLAGFDRALGPLIGMPTAPTSTAPLKNISDLTNADELFDLLPLIVGGALALAFVAALDALLCAKLVTPPGAPRLHGNPLLVRLGFANVLSACFGGITAGVNIGPTLANRAFGGKTIASVLINAAVLLVVIAALYPLVTLMPRAVLSGAIMVIAIQHIDPWTVDLLRRVTARVAQHRASMLLDLSVAVLVAVLSVTVNIVLAIFWGLAVACAMFVLRMSRSPVRRAYRCDNVRSRKARTPAEAAALDRDGGRILVLELQGPLFFGSAETLAQHIEEKAGDAQIIIVDLRRVTEIDATGAQIVAEIAAALKRKSKTLELALTSGSEIAARLHEAGTVEAVGLSHLFEDVDRAIEWAEDETLRAPGGMAGGPEDGEVQLARVELFRDFTEQEMRTLKVYAQRETFARGREIFREGEPGKELLILVKGSVSAYLNPPGRGRIRLATFSPATVVGELAILDSGPRSATIAADEDVVCYMLSQAALARLAQEEPTAVIKLLAGLGRELSGRLRRANRTIQQLES